MQRQNLYQETTLFDQLREWLFEAIRQRLPRKREAQWGMSLMGAGFCLGASALVLVFHIAFAGLVWNQYLAQGVAAAGLCVAAWRLLLAGEQALRRPVRRVGQWRRRHVTPPVERRDPRNAEARAFFERLRAAGVNVRIARALVTGGVRSAERVRAMTDEELLAIRGVGPATVRKLRACCRASD